MEIRYVEWLDSRGVASRWTPKADAEEARPSRCASVGFLLNESDQHVSLLQSHDGDTEDLWIDNVIVIPRVAITKTQTLGIGEDA